MKRLTRINETNRYCTTNCERNQSDMPITRPNCALDMRTILCLYVPGFQRQVFKHVKIVLERSKEMKKQKKKKGTVLVAESAYISQNAQCGLLMPQNIIFLVKQRFGHNLNKGFEF